MPLISGEGAIGVLSLDSVQVESFAPAQAELLVTFADQAAIAVVNARLYDQAQITAVAGERERCPQTSVLALTSFAEPRLVQEAVNAGATGYLLKNVSASELADAVFAAAEGRTMMGPEAVQALVQIAANPRPIGSDLTPRGREILALLARGMTNYEIAQRMTISEATVRFHVGNILGKLEVGNRTEAAQVAFKHHLVEP